MKDDEHPGEWREIGAMAAAIFVAFAISVILIVDRLDPQSTYPTLAMVGVGSMVLFTLLGINPSQVVAMIFGFTPPQRPSDRDDED